MTIVKGHITATVVVPTYNRANYLRKCLNAIACQTADPSQFEVLVVDNNSRDNTGDVLRHFANLHPQLKLRHVIETMQGTSYARNRGVQEACGEYICYTEDDAAPFPNWLELLMNSFAEPEIGCVGGPITLDYQGQHVPLYLRGDLQGLIGGFTLPYKAPTLVSTWTEFPWGGNMAFRRCVFENVGLFPTELGPSGEKRLSAEETELISRVHKSGWKVLYCPDVRVTHFVPSERLEKSHLYYVGFGLASSHVLLTGDPRLHKVMRWFASDFWYATRMGFKLVLAILQRKTLWFDDYMVFWMVWMRIPLRLRLLYRRVMSRLRLGSNR